MPKQPAGAALAAAATLDAACAALRRLTAELEAGRDAVPAQLFAAEALLERALAEGIAPPALRAAVAALLPDADALRIDQRDGRAVVALQLWQRRAPVTPSTAD